MLTPSKKTKEYHKGPCGLENMYRKHWPYTSLVLPSIFFSFKMENLSEYFKETSTVQLTN